MAERELDPLLSVLAAAGGNESQQPGGTVQEIMFLSGSGPGPGFGTSIFGCLRKQNAGAAEKT